MGGGGGQAGGDATKAAEATEATGWRAAKARQKGAAPRNVGPWVCHGRDGRRGWQDGHQPGRCSPPRAPPPLRNARQWATGSPLREGAWWAGGVAGLQRRPALQPDGRGYNLVGPPPPYQERGRPIARWVQAPPPVFAQSDVMGRWVRATGKTMHGRGRLDGCFCGWRPQRTGGALSRRLANRRARAG